MKTKLNIYLEEETKHIRLHNSMIHGSSDILVQLNLDLNVASKLVWEIGTTLKKAVVFIKVNKF